MTREKIIICWTYRDCLGTASSSLYDSTFVNIYAFVVFLLNKILWHRVNVYFSPIHFGPLSSKCWMHVSYVWTNSRWISVRHRNIPYLCLGNVRELPNTRDSVIWDGNERLSAGYVWYERLVCNLLSVLWNAPVHLSDSNGIVRNTAGLAGALWILSTSIFLQRIGKRLV